MALQDFLEHLRRRRDQHRSEVEQREDKKILERGLGRLSQSEKHRSNLRELQQGLDRFAPRDDRLPSPMHLPQGEERQQNQVLRRIEVYAFVGSSGTGKSTRAIELASELQIEYIIDDGLLIHGSRIVAGTTAKRADTRLQAVRVAIFLDEGQANTMRRALTERRPDKLLILGTSDNMIQKITDHLHLSPPVRTIRIDEVASLEEQLAAQEQRKRSGHHTIPVPGMEIKHEFSGHLTGTWSRFFRRRDRDDAARGYMNDRTVVRPTFSTLGRYSISQEAMQQLVTFIVREVPGIAGLSKLKIEAQQSGVLIDLDLILNYGFNAPKTLRAVQEQVAAQVERLSGMNVLAVNTMAYRLEPRPQETQAQ